MLNKKNLRQHQIKRFPSMLKKSLLKKQLIEGMDIKKIKLLKYHDLRKFSYTSKKDSRNFLRN